MKNNGPALEGKAPARLSFEITFNMALLFILSNQYGANCLLNFKKKCTLAVQAPNSTMLPTPPVPTSPQAAWEALAWPGLACPAPGKGSPTLALRLALLFSYLFP